jgi:thiol-disulfide isomerase/thioredoxin
MIFSWLRLLIPFSSRQRIFSTLLLTLVAGLSCLFLLGLPPALAGLNDDRFDGSIFTLYAGNGSLVPPKVPLAESLKQGKPALLVFYLDDSSDCKQYSPTVSQLQAFYGRAADFIPINVDSVPQKLSYASTEPGYYYDGFVPQTVLFDQSGQIVLNARGKIPFEQIDDVFRKVFNLLPRSESVELKRRSINEFNTELVQP